MRARGLGGNPAESGWVLRREEALMRNEPRATDVLANERTFLAYCRTSLSFIAFGFVVARFALFTREFDTVLHVTEQAKGISTMFSTAVAIFGGLIAIYGGYRYVQTARALAGARAIALSPLVAMISAGVIALIGLAVGIGLVAVK